MQITFLSYEETQKIRNRLSWFYFKFFQTSSGNDCKLIDDLYKATTKIKEDKDREAYNFLNLEFDKRIQSKKDAIEDYKKKILEAEKEMNELEVFQRELRGRSAYTFIKSLIS